MPDPDFDYGGLTRGDIVERVNELRQLHQQTLPDRSRIRAVMDGGPDGLRALLGNKVKGIGSDIPAPNLIASGMERLAQKLSDMPILRADPPARVRDEHAARERAEKRERIVENYDDVCRMDLQLPYMVRWLIGYGYGCWIIRDWRSPDGHHYPYAELRDPWDVYPGYWGPSHIPEDLAVIRRVPAATLARIYPDYADQLIETDQRYNRQWAAGGLILNPRERSSENPGGTGLEVVEYYNSDGTWLYIPEKNLMVDYQPNPLRSGPRFVFLKRFSFNALQGQYSHAWGLQAQLTKMNVLELIAMEDSIFAPTNITGDIANKKFKRGRFATNYFPPGTQIQKMADTINPQVFQAIDRTERHARIAANYPVADDGQSPNAFVTGRGLEQLAGSGNLLVQEYQMVLRRGLEDLDRKRLEWDERMYPKTRKPLVYVRDGAPHTETYVPGSDISGNHLTRRVFGVMAGLDQPSKIVAILQLLQARLIDRRTAMEQLKGLDDIPKILRNVLEDETEKFLIEMLAQMGADPTNPDSRRARLAFIQVYQDASKLKEVLAKFFSPEEPPESEAEEQFLNPPQPIEVPGQPPPVSTVLSRLEQSGATEGGVQTVARV